MDYKIYKFFNLNLIKFFFITIIIIILINVTVDPFNVFGTPTRIMRPEAKYQERVTKITALKLDKRKIKTAYIGTSRVDLAINPEYEKEHYNNETINLAMGGLYNVEYIALITAILNNHPEIEHIYIGWDFQMFNKNQQPANDFRSEIDTSNKLTPNEIAMPLFSFTATENSIWTIIKNCLGIESRMFYNTGVKHIFLNENITKDFNNTYNEYSSKYTNYTLDKNAFKIPRAIINLCEEKNIKVTFFIMPAHTSLLDLIQTCGIWDEFLLWKSELANISPIYDFYYPNEISNSAISPDMRTFYDASHATYIVGNRIIDKLERTNNGNSNFGRILTKDNVKIYNELTTKQLQDWKQNNQELHNHITEIVNKAKTNNAD